MWPGAFGAATSHLVSVWCSRIRPIWDDCSDEMTEVPAYVLRAGLRPRNVDYHIPRTAAGRWNSALGVRRAAAARANPEVAQPSRAPLGPARFRIFDLPLAFRARRRRARNV